MQQLYIRTPYLVTFVGLSTHLNQVPDSQEQPPARISSFSHLPMLQKSAIFRKLLPYLSPNCHILGVFIIYFYIYIKSYCTLSPRPRWLLKKRVTKVPRKSVISALKPPYSAQNCGKVYLVPPILVRLAW